MAGQIRGAGISIKFTVESAGAENLCCRWGKGSDGFKVKNLGPVIQGTTGPRPNSGPRLLS
jgi:hypothetical protein